MKKAIVILLFSTLCAAQMVKPALPPLKISVVDQKKAAVKPAYPPAPKEHGTFTLSGDVWVPPIVIYSYDTRVIDPCSWQGGTQGKDGKCHIEIQIWPKDWTCDFAPATGTLRCTFDPEK